MKTISDINAIRDALQSEVVLRGEPTPNDTRIVVGMGDIGIAHGAKAVFETLVDAISANLATHVKVMREAIDCDEAEAPVVIVTAPDAEPVRYTNVDAAKAEEIFQSFVK